MNERTLVELFAGIAGFGLGFERAGFKTVCQVEIDPNCHRLLKSKYPEAIQLDDIRTCHSKEYLDTAVRTWFHPLNNDDEIMAGHLKKLTAAQAEECAKLYSDGLSLQAVADYFDVSRQAMWDLLRRRITLRPQKRTGKDNHFYRGGKSADAKAQNILEEAIERGIVTRKSKCEQCGDTGTFADGRTKIQAHHCDYNKPLEVLWLCQKCHHKWHKSNKPIRKEVLQEVPKADIVVGGFP